MHTKVQYMVEYIHVFVHVYCNGVLFMHVQAFLLKICQLGEEIRNMSRLVICWKKIFFCLEVYDLLTAV